jgi:Flp pilus assembly protein TadG
MTGAFSWPARLHAALKQQCKDERASQIVEFALSLPLLVLFVVGIFEFSGAISLKQKLTNAAREGARVAAADPANDLANATLPASVADAFQVVDNYLISENIPDCGLGSASPTTTRLTWVFRATASPCPANAAFVLTINRACIQKANAVNLVGTCVTIQYPYQWQLTLVGGTAGGPFLMTTTTMAFNEN